MPGGLESRDRRNRNAAAAGTLKGNVYMLQSNPPNLQLLVAASGDGVNLKLIGNVHLDETTGRLTTTFEAHRRIRDPGRAAQRIRVDLQRRRAGGAGDPADVRCLHLDRGVHAVEQPVHRRRAVAKRLRDHERSRRHGLVHRRCRSRRR